MITRREFFKGAAAAGIGLVILRNQLKFAGRAGAAPALAPGSLTKFLDPLVVPPAMPKHPTQPFAGTDYYEIGMYQFEQNLHSEMANTTVWGYGAFADSNNTKHYPSFTIEARRNRPVKVKWLNELVDGSGAPLPHLLTVDPTLHWADPENAGPQIGQVPAYRGPVPTVVHVHGADVLSTSDGHPDAWFTPRFAAKGKAWQQGVSEIYTYPNEQPPTTIWYHDHGLGITRLNVYCGLAGFFIVRDPAIEAPFNLPSGEFEIPLAIQDKMFDEEGQLVFPAVGDNPDIHPYWLPEFFGDTMLVNGVVWPKLNVKPAKYRFRMLNGCNARFIVLTLDNNRPFTVIGSDGGYLPTPMVVSELRMGPGERYDVVVDFSGLAGSNVVMKNSGVTPYPDGDPALGVPGEPGTLNEHTDRVMQFIVDGVDVPGALPTTLLARDTLTPGPVVRTKLLLEVMGDNGPVAATLDGLMWDAPLTEHPEIGSTEVWKVLNLTGDAHPMHWHLVQFQVLDRQAFNATRYMEQFEAANGLAGEPMYPMFPSMDLVEIPPLDDELLLGDPVGPEPQETGWKDTVPMLPGEVTRILVRYAHPDGKPLSNAFTTGPGYVWHCHIVDHEDNEMMRPYLLLPVGNPINGSLLLTNTAISYSPTPEPNAPAGVTTVTLTFTNRSTRTFANLFFKAVAVVAPGNLVLNADGGPSGQGARITVLDSALGLNGLLDPNESFTQTFRIGMARQLPFNFRVSAYGVRFEGQEMTPMAIEDTAPDFEVQVSESAFVPGDNSVFLPTLDK